MSNLSIQQNPPPPQDGVNGVCGICRKWAAKTRTSAVENPAAPGGWDCVHAIPCPEYAGVGECDVGMCNGGVQSHNGVTRATPTKAEKRARAAAAQPPDPAPSPTIGLPDAFKPIAAPAYEAARVLEYCQSELALADGALYACPPALGIWAHLDEKTLANPAAFALICQARGRAFTAAQGFHSDGQRAAFATMMDEPPGPDLVRRTSIALMNEVKSKRGAVAEMSVRDFSNRDAHCALQTENGAWFWEERAETKLTDNPDRITALMNATQWRIPAPDPAFTLLNTPPDALPYDAKVMRRFAFDVVGMPVIERLCVALLGSDVREVFAVASSYSGIGKSMLGYAFANALPGAVIVVVLKDAKKASAFNDIESKLGEYLLVFIDEADKSAMPQIHRLTPDVVESESKFQARVLLRRVGVPVVLMGGKGNDSESGADGKDSGVQGIDWRTQGVPERVHAVCQFALEALGVSLDDYFADTPGYHSILKGSPIAAQWFGELIFQTSGRLWMRSRTDMPDGSVRANAAAAERLTRAADFVAVRDEHYNAALVDEGAKLRELYAPSATQWTPSVEIAAAIGVSTAKLRNLMDAMMPGVAKEQKPIGGKRPMCYAVGLACEADDCGEPKLECRHSELHGKIATARNQLSSLPLNGVAKGD